jgi:hypothetical protein
MTRGTLTSGLIPSDVSAAQYEAEIAKGTSVEEHACHRRITPGPQAWLPVTGTPPAAVATVAVSLRSGQVRAAAAYWYSAEV